jgi:hypothetical protein
MLTYIALVRKEKNSGFGVDFLDFPGCITVGNTLRAREKFFAAKELEPKSLSRLINTNRLQENERN